MLLREIFIGGARAPPAPPHATALVEGQSDFVGGVSKLESVQEKAAVGKKLNNLRKTANKRSVPERKNLV